MTTMRAKRPCTTPGCQGVTFKGGPCDKCKRAAYLDAQKGSA